MRRSSIKSFTLVELLIVIAILAILAAAVVIVINPGEMLAQARDAERISSIESLKKSIDLFVLDNPGVSLGTSQVISISIPDTSATCANITGLPSLPAGWSYRCVTAANLRNLDSTGWLPINLTTIKGGSPLPSLPIDPDNTALTRYYQYIPGSTSGSYELTTLLESEKQSKIAGKDGGTDPGRLETGTDISLWKTASGLVAYWPFEGIGSVTNGQVTGMQDTSGNGINGTASNVNGTGMAFVSGRLGQAIQLDGTDDYIDCGISGSMGLGNFFSVSVWTKFDNVSSGTRVGNIIGNFSNSPSFNFEGNLNGTSRFWWNGGSPDIIGNRDLRGSWHNIVITRDGPGNKNTIYIDGVVDKQASSGSNIDPQWPMRIGNDFRASPGIPYHGAIDELRIFNRLISASEVTAIYNSGK